LVHNDHVLEEEKVNPMGSNFYQGLLWLAIGGIILYLSSNYKLGTPSDPGPGALPFGLGLVITFLSMILIVCSLRVKGFKFEHPLPYGPRYCKVLLITLVLVLDTFLLESLGYLLSVFILITIPMFILEPKRWISPLLLGIISSISSYVLFDIWLRVPLPKGLFSFLR
jgi:hypothetical protein